ncbi:Lrp/AsnC family transcriptional regulator [Elongatibacter sediminis]|uniref:Lrp/AsnC family transcriptional regulator n=1 Tax=Elongatibacter sediminis TaxID=3119006 RepID=A0AAW9R697_9GAMM
MTHKLDRTDLRILDALQTEGRISNVELAERLNLSPTPVARRWRRLEREGYLTGYSARIDAARVGLTVTSYVSVRLRANDWRTASAFEDGVKTLPNVIECCVVSGSSDYLLRVVAASLEDYEQFLKRELAGLEAVASIDSTIVLSQVIERTELPLG